VCAAGCKGPTPPGCWVHEESRNRTLVVLVPNVPGLWRAFTHANCVCNQIMAITNRVIGKVPVPTRDGLVRLRSMAKRVFSWIKPLEPWSDAMVVASFNDQRKKVYQRAAESLVDREFNKADGRINAFIKAELYNPKDKRNPDPRVIQARTVRYNIKLGNYLRPLEHRILNMRSERGLRIFAKGQNAIERAAEIRSKFDAFPSTVCFSIDASRWDKHVSREVLEIEHSVYKRAFPGDPLLQRMLDYQLLNRCSTRDGVRYLANGRRMSGDLNTGLGNCVLMVLMVHAIMRLLKIPFEIYDDGDDCLLFVPRECAALLRRSISDAFLEFGQEIKLENEAVVPEQVVFCQSKMINTMVGWKMIRNWRKVMSHGTTGIKHWNNIKLVKPMLTAVGSCELALNRGVPILQAYALALRRLGEGQRPKVLDVRAGLMIRTRYELRVSHDSLEAVVYGARPLPISDDARRMFAEVWGTPVWEQLSIEQYLSTWHPDLGHYLVSSNDVDSKWREIGDVNNFLRDVY